MAGVRPHRKIAEVLIQFDILRVPAAAHPNLRSTVPIVANQIHTVAPRLYFNPALLEELHNSANAGPVNWPQEEVYTEMARSTPNWLCYLAGAGFSIMTANLND